MKFEVLMKAITVFFEDYVLFPLSNISLFDILDIVLLAMLLYVVYRFIRAKHVGRLSLGVVAFLALYVVSDWLGMIAINSILKNIFTVGIIGLCLIFQPELRSALEVVGSASLKVRNIAQHGLNIDEEERNAVTAVAAAAHDISSRGEGALIVFAKDDGLTNHMTPGIQLNADVTKELICNIFVNKSPLHDGAVIIKNNKIAEASSKVKTIATSSELEGLGTRHRAAVRISEVADVVVVVVSEETKTISIANNGYLKRHYDDVAIGGRHKMNDLRDDLYILLTGKEIPDMINARADNGDILSETELSDLEIGDTEVKSIEKE